ncbi:MATE family efflux transporter [Eubacteriaceae bacterium ES2]|nr:MATE family efflux transporter [Eubacteriaceae bacterium ES2]
MHKKGNLVDNLFSGTLLIMVMSAMISLIGMLIDGLVIGNFLGVDAMAAYGLATPIFVIIAAVGGVFSSGLQTVCAKLLGGGKIDEAKQSFSAMLITGMITGLSFMLILSIFSGWLATALGASGDSSQLYEPTRDYLFGLGLGIPGMIIMNLLTPIMQLDNDRDQVMKATICMTAVNITGDMLVAFVLPWGMFGMALFTSISYYAALIVLLLHFLKKDIMFRPDFRHANMKQVPSMISIGIPTAVSRVCNTMRTLCLNKLLLFLASSGAVAALSIQSNMVGLFGSVGTGIGLATLMLAGLFYGEEDTTSLNHLVKAGLKKILLIVLPIAIILFLFSPLLVKMYGAQSSAEVQTMATNAVRFYAISLPLYSINIVVMNYLQGTHKLKLSNFVSFLDNFGFVVLIAVVLGNILGPNGVWMAFPVGEVFTLIVVFILAYIHEHRLPLKTENYLFLEQNFDVTGNQKFESAITNNEQVMAVSCQVMDFCEANGIKKRESNLISLYVEEMGKNIISYGFNDGKSHNMDFKLVLKESEAILRFRDDCVKFDPKQYIKLLNPEDEISHIGIRMVMKSCDQVEYVNAMTINNLRLHINI